MASIKFSTNSVLQLITAPKFPICTRTSYSVSLPSSSPSSSFICCSFPKRTKPRPGFMFNGALYTSACSTTPFIGRVGWLKREGSASQLNFGINPNYAEVSKTTDTSQLISSMLPFVVAITAIAALAQPSTFTWVSKDLYAPALGGIMLSIGIKLSFDDFALALKRPVPLSVGYFAQYVIKPALGITLAKVFGMPQMFYAGFVLTACVAGAQLSSYASFLSKGDVAMSILLTSSATITSAFVTPLLTGLLIGSVVPVDAIAMSKSILQVVLVPISLGLVLNTYAKPVVDVLQSLMPFVAMICTSICIGSPLAINRSQILSAQGLKLVLPVFAFHSLAFALGYWISRVPFFRSSTEASFATISSHSRSHRSAHVGANSLESQCLSFNAMLELFQATEFAYVNEHNRRLTVFMLRYCSCCAMLLYGYQEGRCYTRAVKFESDLAYSRLSLFTKACDLLWNHNICTEYLCDQLMPQNIRNFSFH